MNKIKLLLIEDNRLLRDGISEMLKRHRDIKVVAASEKGVNSILNIHELKPNVILLDLGLRSQNSLHLVEIVKKEFPQAKVIVMDIAPAQGDILQFVKSGVSGFILKDAAVDDFLTTIRAVAAGQKVLPTILTGSLFSQVIEDAVDGGRKNLNKASRMTKREQEVIGYISNGLSNKEIAQKLSVATYTIKSHVHNIMEKLALHTRLQVANYTFTNGTLSKEIAKAFL
jgi:two-component system nitrate/nitrite response regulator NarL